MDIARHTNDHERGYVIRVCPDIGLHSIYAHFDGDSDFDDYFQRTFHQECGVDNQEKSAKFQQQKKRCSEHRVQPTTRFVP